MPAGLAKLVTRRDINWDYGTEPEPQLRDRRLWRPRGRVLAGSSSISAMCYVRGVARDYDEWAAAGADGWSWRDVLRYFRRSECNTRGADRWHGDAGPLRVADLRHVNPLSHVFVEAAAQAGIPRTTDFTGPVQEGAGLYLVTQKDGARCSSAVAYLRPALKRPDLVVRTGATVARFTIERGHATGVDYAWKGQARQDRVGREVLLSSGAINSPQLLMLSRIGPAAMLRRHGIDVVAGAPGVGANLYHHLDICALRVSSQRVTYDRL